MLCASYSQHESTARPWRGSAGVLAFFASILLLATGLPVCAIAADPPPSGMYTIKFKDGIAPNNLRIRITAQAKENEDDQNPANYDRTFDKNDIPKGTTEEQARDTIYTALKSAGWKVSKKHKNEISIKGYNDGETKKALVQIDGGDDKPHVRVEIKAKGVKRERVSPANKNFKFSMLRPLDENLGYDGDVVVEIAGRSPIIYTLSASDTLTTAAVGLNTAFGNAGFATTLTTSTDIGEIKIDWLDPQNYALLGDTVDINNFGIVRMVDDEFFSVGPHLQIEIPQFVPEPSTVILATLGLLGLAFYGWRRKRIAA